MTWLHTRMGSINFESTKYNFDVLDGGVLRITRGNDMAHANLISPGFWVAVMQSDDDKLDWESLVPNPDPGE